MGWAGHLSLDYYRAGQRTVGHDVHQGPLRVLQRLYPEGEQVCHQVLVHPPGGLVAGDTLDLRVHLRQGAHALITTPGATRFYRSESDWAVQDTRIHLENGARLEWLPLETLAYPHCKGRNQVTFSLASGAQLMGWDVLALGLPASGHLFDAGQFVQHVEIEGIWLERGCLDGTDTRLLHSPVGLNGHSVMATLWLAQGDELNRSRKDSLLDLARSVSVDPALGAASAVKFGVTAPNPHMVVLRALGSRVEPVISLLQSVWAAWRVAHWQMQPCAPRIWKM